MESKSVKVCSKYSIGVCNFSKDRIFVDLSNRRDYFQNLKGNKNFAFLLFFWTLNAISNYENQWLRRFPIKNKI